jgi:hypothetical protein
MKNSTFWNIKPCSQPKFSLRFGAKCRLSRRGRRVSRLQADTISLCFVISSSFKPEDGGDMFRLTVDFYRTERLYTPEDMSSRYISRLHTCLTKHN